MSVVLKLENIEKSFPGVRALHNMQIELRKGELHAICGENGAGKSTLMKVITGVHKADKGDIYLNGTKVEIKEPNDAYSKGIAIIFQETSLFKDLTVLENLYMGHEIKKKKLGIESIDYKAMQKEAKNIFNFLGINIDLDEKIDELGVADKQMVEIAKALTYGANILILDEPTAALTNKEVRALFDTIKRLKANGISMMYISHRMEEILEMADRVTVIRDGEFVKTLDIKEVTEKQLIELMVGREMNELYPKADVKLGDSILKVNNLTKAGLFENIDFELKQGEILGFAGLAGAGRTEIAEAICKIRGYDSGTVEFFGENLNIKTYRDAINKGILYASEDRKKYGLVLELSIKENTTLSILHKISKSSFIDFKEEENLANEYMDKFKTKAPDCNFAIENMSGGNQQKVLLAKALAARPKVLILDEPTRGVDVGAKSEIHRIISNLAKEGMSIIMISSDMPELLGMSDRVVVIKQGKKMGEILRKDFSQEKVLELAL
ncbi:sugar ABC transporter ATP-binding protein [Clostridioides difficile]